MQYLFLLLALLIFLWPLWLLIWVITQKRKNGVFPWKKLIIIVLTTIVLLFLVSLATSQFLGGINRNLGTGSFNENGLSPKEATSSNGVIDLR